MQDLEHSEEIEYRNISETNDSNKDDASENVSEEMGLSGNI